MVIFGASSFMFVDHAAAKVTNLVKSFSVQAKIKVDLNKKFKCKFSKTTPDSKTKATTHQK